MGSFPIIELESLLLNKSIAKCDKVLREDIRKLKSISLNDIHQIFVWIMEENKQVYGCNISLFYAFHTFDIMCANVIESKLMELEKKEI